MTAIIVGGGLGLFGSSATQQNGYGAGGNAAIGGQGSVQAYVNASNGNLILQSPDEFISAVGLDDVLLQTYNSQGSIGQTVNGFDGVDSWMLSAYRSLSGLINARINHTAITRIDPDGHADTFTYSSNLSATNGVPTWISADGSGPNATITYNSTTGLWTYQQSLASANGEYETTGQSGGALNGTDTTEVYSSTGQLVSTTDLNGNTLNYSFYTSGSLKNLLNTVTDASGQTVTLTYDSSNRLSGFKIVGLTPGATSSGSTETLYQVAFSYTPTNQLSSVSVELNPYYSSATPATGSSNVFTTTYSYQSTTSNLITGVAQSDGSVLSITYVSGTGKVQSVTDGLGNVTQFSYNSGSTTVTDPIGNQTVYAYNSSGLLTGVTLPAIGGTTNSISYQYDANNNVKQVTDAQGRIFKYNYDSNGNLLSSEDSLGNTVSYTYDANNHLASQTVYLTPGSANFGTTAASNPKTTNYLYDGNENLRFVVSAQGDVTEYRYQSESNGTTALTNGERVSTITYPAAQYTGTTFTTTALANWAAAQNQTQIRLTSTAYDLTGQVKTVTAWTNVNSSGVGIADGTQSVTHYVYDLNGRLLMQIDPRAASAVQSAANPYTSYDDNATPYVTSYVYDGVGRVLTLQNGAGLNTLTAYGNANPSTTTNGFSIAVTSTAPNGTSTVTTENSDGEIISVAHAVGGAQEDITYYAYDQNGNQTTVTDPTGLKTYTLYDARNRAVATISPEMEISVTAYNNDDQAISVTRYANVLASGTSLLNSYGDSQPLSTVLAGLQTTQPASLNRTTYSYYDAAGRLAYTLDGSNSSTWYVTGYAYDGASDLVGKTQYYTPLSSAPSGGNSTSITVTANPTYDRTTSYFYDSDGRETGALDPDGYLTQTVYNSAGQVQQNIAYAAQVPSADTGETFTQLLALVTNNTNVPGANDHVSWTLYDGQGRVAATVDADGYLTANTYDLAGNLNQQTRYVNPVTYSGTQSLSSLITAASGTGNQIQTSDYDALNRLAYQVDFQGTGTVYNYDATTGFLDSKVAGETTSTFTATGDPTTNPGYLVAQTDQLGNSAVTADTYFYDYLGRVNNVLLGNASATYAYDASTGYTSSQLSAVAQSLGTKTVYDTAGRVAKSIDPDGNVTTYDYTPDSQLAYTVNGAGDVTGKTYDAFGDVATSTDYASPVTTAGLSGGLLSTDTSLSTQLTTAFLGNTLNRTTQYAYNDNRGLLTETIDPMLFTVVDSYNAFGEVATTVSDVGATPGAVSRTDTTQYDNRGAVTETTEDSGGLNLTTETSYDAFGRVVEVQDPAGDITQYGYDNLGRTTSVTDGLADITATGYDAFGRVTSVTDATGATTTYSYSDNTQTMTMVNALGIAVATIRNRRGQSIQVTDGSGDVTDYTYDADGNLKTTSTADGTVTNNYDAADLLSSTVDADGITTSYTYDSARRVLTETVDPTIVDPIGLNLLTQYGYDAFGDVVGVNDPTGTTTTTVFNNDGRSTAVIVDSAGLALATTYTYDALGNVLTEVKGQQASDSTGVWSYSTPAGTVLETTTNVYDAAGRLAYTIDGQGDVTGYTYDADGRVTQTTSYATPINVGLLAPNSRPYDVQTLLALLSNDLANGASALNLPSSGITYSNGALQMQDTTTANSTPGATGPLRTLTNGSIGFSFTINTGALNSNDPFWVGVLGLSTSNVGLRLGLKFTGGNVSVNYYTSPGGYQNQGFQALNTTVQANTNYVVQIQISASGGGTIVLYQQGKLPSTGVSYSDQLGTNYSSSNPPAWATWASAYAWLGTESSTAQGYANSSMSISSLLEYSVDGNGNPLPVNSAGDETTTNVYDAAGRLSYTIDPMGDVTGYAYDGDGRLTQTTKYAAPMSSELAGNASGVTLPASGIIDSNGALVMQDTTSATGTSYPGATGPLRSLANGSLGYSFTVNTGALNSNEPFWVGVQGYATSGAALRLGIEFTGRSVSVNYNGSPGGNSNQVVTSLNTTVQANTNYVIQVQISANGGGTITLYRQGQPPSSGVSYSDGLGPQAWATWNSAFGWLGSESNSAYNTTSSMSVTNWVEYLDPNGTAAPASSAGDETTTNVYDAAGRLSYTIDPMGDVTGYTYDGDGRVTQTTKYAAPMSSLLADSASGVALPSSGITYYNGALVMQDTNASTTYPTATGDSRTLASGSLGYSFTVNTGALNSNDPFWVGAQGYSTSGQFLRQGILFTGSSACFDYYTYPNGNKTENKVPLTLGPLKANTNYIIQIQITATGGTTTIYQQGQPWTADTGPTDDQSWNSAFGWLGSESSSGYTTSSMSVTNWVEYLDPNGTAAPASSAGDETTTNVYDAAGRLSYTIDPMGDVTGYTYDGDGRLTQTTKYAAPMSSELADNASDVTLPASGIIDSNGALVMQDTTASSTVYPAATDQVQNTRTLSNGSLGYSFTVNTGALNSNDPFWVGAQGYSTSGQFLRQGILFRGSNAYFDYYTYPNGQKTENEVSLGSVKANTNYIVQLQITATGGTTTIYQQGQPSTAVTSPTDGQSWNSAFGWLGSESSSGYTTSSMSVTNWVEYLDPNGTAAPVSSANDEITTSVYDAAGRLAYSIDALGDVTGYTYDRDGRVTQTIEYATPLPAGTAHTLAGISAAVASSPSEVTQNIYDTAGRLAYSVDAVGDVTGYTYDGVGRVTKTTRYAQPLLGDFVTNASGNLNNSSGWQASSGGTISVVSAAAVGFGANTAGEALAFTGATQYLGPSISATSITSGEQFNVSMDAVNGSSNYSAAIGLMYFSSSGQELGYSPALSTTYTVNGVQHIDGGFQASLPANTAYVCVYVIMGGTSGSTGTWYLRNLYAAPATGGTMNWLNSAANPLQAIQGALVTSTGDETTSNFYNAAGLLAYSVDAVGDVTGYTYNSEGQVTQTTKYATPINLSLLPISATAHDVQVLLALLSNDLSNGASVLALTNNGISYSNGSVLMQDTTTSNAYPTASDQTQQTRSLSNGAIGYSFTINTGALNGNDVFWVGVQGYATSGAALRLAVKFTGNQASADYEVSPGGGLHQGYSSLGTVQANTNYVVQIQISANGGGTITLYQQGQLPSTGTSYSDGLGPGSWATWASAYAWLGGEDSTSNGYVTSSMSLSNVLEYGVDGNGNPLPVNSTGDETNTNVYDADGRLAYTVDPMGNVSGYQYNVEGQVTQTIKYGTPIVLSALPTAPQVADIENALAEQNGGTVDDFNNGLGNYSFVNGVSTGIQIVNQNNSNRLQLTSPGTNQNYTTMEGSTDYTITPSTPRAFRYEFTPTTANGAYFVGVDSTNGMYDLAEFDNGTIVSNTWNGSQNVIKSLGSYVTGETYIVEVLVTPTSSTLYVYLKGASRASGYTSVLNASWSDARIHVQTANIAAEVAYIDSITTSGELLDDSLPAAVAAQPGSFYDNFQNGLGNYTISNDGTPSIQDIDNRLQLTSSSNSQNLSELTSNVNYTISSSNTKVFRFEFTPTSYTGQYEVGAQSADGTVYNLAEFSNENIYAVTRAGSTTSASMIQIGDFVAGTTYVVEVVVTATRSTLYVYAEGNQTRAEGVSYQVNAAWNNANVVVQTLVGNNEIAYIGNIAVTNSLLDDGVDDSGPDEITTTDYDADGQITQIIDALGNTQSYTYDAFGNKLSYTNQDGNTWSYQYDALNRLVLQVDPVTETYTINGLGQAPSVSTNSSSEQEAEVIGYDQFGNVLSTAQGYTVNTNGVLAFSGMRATDYLYDLLNRQIQTVNAAQSYVYRDQTDSVLSGDSEVEVYDEASDSSTGFGNNTSKFEMAETLNTNTFYNSLGQAIVGEDAAGNFTYKIYNNLNQLIYEVDGERGVTSYSYDAFGNLLLTVRYAIPLNQGSLSSGLLNLEAAIIAAQAANPGNPGAAAVQNAVEAAQAQVLSLANALSSPFNSSNRVIYTSYDALNRKSEVAQSAVAFYLPTVGANGSVGSSYSGTASPITTYVYDAFGDLTTESSLLNPDTLAWATSYYGYNADGEQTDIVDPLGYYTHNQYDAFGNLVLTDQYAQALTGGAPTTLPSFTSVAFQATVVTTIANPSNPNLAGYDRVMTYGYDQRNRQISQTREGAEVATINANVPTNIVSNVTTTTTYDGVGNVIATEDAQDNITYTYYNALGEVIGLRQPLRTALVSGTYVTLAPLTAYEYDLLGDQIDQVVYSTNITTNPSNAGIPAGGSSANDQYSYKRYDTLGRVVETVDAGGNIEDFAYDQFGNIGRQWRNYTDIINGTSAPLTQVNAYTYDRDGRQLSAVKVVVSPLSGSAPDVITTASTYDTFGEQISRQITDTADSSSDGSDWEYYDNDGHLLRTDQSGVTTVYGYDMLGDATAKVVVPGEANSSPNQGPGPNILVTSLAQAQSYFGAIETDTVYDSMGREVAQIEPSSQQGQDAPGSVGASVVSIGAVTKVTTSGLSSTYNSSTGDTTYSLQLNWGALNLASSTPLQVAVYTNLGGQYAYAVLDTTVSSTPGGMFTASWSASGDLPAVSIASVQVTADINITNHQWVLVSSSMGSGIGMFAPQIPGLEQSTGVPDQNQNSGLNSINGIVPSPFDIYASGSFYYRVSGSSSAYSQASISDDQFGAFVANVGTLANGTYEYYFNTINGQFDGNYGGLPGPLDASTTVAGRRYAGTFTISNGAITGFGAPPLQTLQGVQTQTVDRWGNVTSFTDARSTATNPIVTQYFYNDQNKLIETIQPSVTVWDANTSNNTSMNQPGTPTSFVFYDNLGNRIATEDANGEVTENSYDADGDEISVRNPMDITTFSSFDALGRDVQDTDGDGYVTNKQYNTLNELIFQQISGFNQSTTYTYDALGDRTSQADALGDTTRYRYDSMGRLVQTLSPLAGTNVTSPYVTTYGYDSTGNKISSAEGTVMESWRYDYFGRLIEHTDTAGNSSYQYYYDAFGNLLQLKSNTITGSSHAIQGSSGQSGDTTSTSYTTGGENLQYSYYANGWLESIVDTSPQSGVASATTLYRYDVDGNRILEQYSQIDSNDNPSNAASYFQDSYISYDNLGRVAQVDNEVPLNSETYQQGSNYPILSIDRTVINYGYDAVGNRRRILGLDLYSGSIYGPSGDATLTPYDYWFTYDGNNRLTLSEGQVSDGVIVAGTTGTQLAYDGDGNRVSAKTGTSTDPYSDYTYNAAGQLLDTYTADTSSLPANPSAPNQLLTTAQTYNAGGSLSSTENYTVNTSAGTSTPDTLDTLYYDANGWLIAQEQETYSAGSGLNDTALVSYSPSVSSSNFNSGLPGSSAFLSDPGYYDSLGNPSEYLAYVYPNASGSGSPAYNNYYYFDYEKAQDGEEVGYETADTTAPNYVGGQTAYTYDDHGHTIEVVNPTLNELDEPTSKYYVVNEQGEILEQTINAAAGETDNGSYFAIQQYVFANGQQLGSVGNLSKETFDYNYTPISAEYPAANPGQYVVQTGDTLQSIATRYYGDASLWYLIADANGLSNSPSDVLTGGLVLNIPNQVTDIHNNASTDQPYSPAQVIGDNTPQLKYVPPPGPNNNACAGVLSDAIGGLVSIIVQAVVTAVLDVVSFGTLSPVATQIGAFVGGVLGYNATAVTDAVLDGQYNYGNAALSFIPGYSLAFGKGTVLDRFGEMLDPSTAGVSDYNFGKALETGVIDAAASYAGAEIGQAANGLGSTAASVANAVASNITSQSLDIAVGFQHNFSWSELAASAVTSGLNAQSPASAPPNTPDGILQNTLIGTANGFVGQTVGVLLSGAGKIQFANIAADAFGNALGNAVVGAIQWQQQVNKLSPDALRLYNYALSTGRSADVALDEGQWLDQQGGLSGLGIGFAGSSGAAQQAQEPYTPSVTPLTAEQLLVPAAPDISSLLPPINIAWPNSQGQTAALASSGTSTGANAAAAVDAADSVNAVNSGSAQPQVAAEIVDATPNGISGGGSVSPVVLAGGAVVTAASSLNFSSRLAVGIDQAISIEEGSAPLGPEALATGAVIGGVVILGSVLPPVSPGTQASLAGHAGSMGAEGQTGFVPTSTGSGEYNGVSSSVAANSLAAPPISASPPGFPITGPLPGIPPYVPTADNNGITLVTPPAPDLGPPNYITPVATDVPQITNTASPADSGVPPLLAMASQSSPPLADAWNLDPTERGNFIEAYLASTEYSQANGWDHLGAENNGFFPVVDFQQGNTLVSLKTWDTSGSTSVGTIEGYIDSLAGTTIDGQTANLVLDLRVQPGGLAVASQVIGYGTQQGVTVIVKEFK